jgi:hypothetical protein
MPAFEYTPRKREGDKRKKFPALPEGWYVCEIPDPPKWKVSHKKPDAPSYLGVRLDIIEGKHVGRCFFVNLHLNAENEIARMLSEDLFEELLMAVGLDKLTHTDQLLGQPIKVLVKIKTSEEFGEQNEVKKFRPISTVTGDESEKKPDEPPTPQSCVARGDGKLDDLNDDIPFGHDDDRPADEAKP